MRDVCVCLCCLSILFDPIWRMMSHLLRLSNPINRIFHYNHTHTKLTLSYSPPLPNCPFHCDTDTYIFIPFLLCPFALALRTIRLRRLTSFSVVPARIIAHHITITIHLNRITPKRTPSVNYTIDCACVFVWICVCMCVG